MQYVLAALAQMDSGATTILFRARGNAIVRLFNAVNVTTNIMRPTWSIAGVDMTYERIEGNTYTTGIAVRITNEKLI